MAMVSSIRSVLSPKIRRTVKDVRVNADCWRVLGIGKWEEKGEPKHRASVRTCACDIEGIHIRFIRKRSTVQWLE